VPNPKGRPKKATEEKYYDILITACSPDDWRAICEKAVAQAKSGNPVARKWLADYLQGVPVQRNELTGADSGPLVIRVIRSDRTRMSGGSPNPALEAGNDQSQSS
jgi:hypothetical protein